jgi:hypothetical protein
MKHLNLLPHPTQWLAALLSTRDPGPSHAARLSAETACAAPQSQGMWAAVHACMLQHKAGGWRHGTPCSWEHACVKHTRGDVQAAAPLGDARVLVVPDGAATVQHHACALHQHSQDLSTVSESE